MLAAAEAPAHALRLSHHLSQQPERVAGAGKEVAVAAVVREHMILLSQMLGDRDRISLLANARMSGPVEQATIKQLKHALLEASNETHPAVQALSTRLPGQAYQTRIHPCPDRSGDVAVGYHAITLPAAPVSGTTEPGIGR